MTKFNTCNETSDLTRRSFLGKFTLSIAGLVGFGFWLRSLRRPTETISQAHNDLPDDSIFQPRNDMRNKNRTKDFA